MDVVIVFTEENLHHRIEILNLLLFAFNNKDLQLSELKTMLLVSKEFMANPLIFESRKALQETYDFM